MANSKDIRLKKFKIVFGWILGLAIIALSFGAYNIIYGSRGYGCKSPNSAAIADLKNLKTSLMAYYMDHKLRYPKPDEVPSFYEVSDGVTASWMTSDADDKESYVLIAFHKEGDKIYLTTSETNLIYWIIISEQGLVPPNPL